jgi:hypothetical protein
MEGYNILLVPTHTRIVNQGSPRTTIRCRPQQSAMENSHWPRARGYPTLYESFHLYLNCSDPQTIRLGMGQARRIRLGPPCLISHTSYYDPRKQGVCRGCPPQGSESGVQPKPTDQHLPFTQYHTCSVMVCITFRGRDYQIFLTQHVSHRQGA